MPNSSLKIVHSLPLHELSNRWILDIFGTRYSFRAGQYLIYQNDKPNKIYIFLEGWANSHKIFGDEHKQIVNYVLPGDIVGLQFDETEKSPYMIEAVTDVKVLGIEKASFWEKIQTRPYLLFQILRKRERYQRELEKRIISLTASSSFNSMIQILTLLYSRLNLVGIPEEDAKYFPINQLQLSEVLSISYIHTHRIFNRLEKMDFVTKKKHHIHLIDVKGLRKLAYDQSEIQELDRKKRVG
ncbi:hypothetical protein W03_18150 [Nitrosomonas sp. PY1]|uniref:Crp/Fnr family transcriptional regulator n=1 Tax=Nitrosomonas sp. PY1 TaxID=1803906 RepID=UPI001FC8076A|nr:Crp/Fnr family transcriptional regulator [Nitrosomonas sp. PY1]GKS69811.1 hypothetical protein W03_18150 [Nitrosomonas sp. PY1]